MLTRGRIFHRVGLRDTAILGVCVMTEVALIAKFT